MTFNSFIEEALSRGETLRDEIRSELLRSKMVREIVNNEIFVKAVSKAVRTKDEVAQKLRQNVRTVLQLMDVPSRIDLERLGQKFDQLEKQINRIGKQTITVKSLHKIQERRTAQTYSKTRIRKHS